MSYINPNPEQTEQQILELIRKVRQGSSLAIDGEVLARRSTLSLARLTYKGPERRNLIKRRSTEERRSDWVRINKWSSICLSEYMIAKFLK